MHGFNLDKWTGQMTNSECRADLTSQFGLLYSNFPAGQELGEERMNSGQRWGNDTHAEARRTRRKKSCRILTERLSPEVCLMMFTKGTSRNISAPSATPGEAIPAMSLNESIVEGGAMEWFGEQCRGALNLTPTLS